MYRIWTEIDGGVTGNRAAFMKGKDGSPMEFETREQAAKFIADHKAGRSPFATFWQTYKIIGDEE